MSMNLQPLLPPSLSAHEHEYEPEQVQYWYHGVRAATWGATLAPWTAEPRISRASLARAPSPSPGAQN